MGRSSEKHDYGDDPPPLSKASINCHHMAKSYAEDRPPAICASSYPTTGHGPNSEDTEVQQGYRGLSFDVVRVSASAKMKAWAGEYIP
ncbi:hypothetical protein V491_00506 [Pseudogymnoascus sp. VKM F-3775]|nr:hypothetical protein V491_00506 [Pseudogymnoascus sp. VKM F-3775]